MRVLVVEDDVKLVRALRRGLEAQGWAVDAARTGDEGLEQATRESYDVVVLDLMLPGRDGLEICARLRERGRQTPVLMLTARSSVDDRIRGLDGGADDYLVKPFDLGELSARLRALVRRGPQSDVVTVGQLSVRRSTRTATWGERSVDLTAREVEVLDVLLRSPDEPVSRQRLLATVWHADSETSPGIVDVYIGYLRRKFEGLRPGPSIRTVRGRGYLLDVS